MPKRPSLTEGNGDGRDAKTGRFVAGNKLAVGNPFASRVARMRATMMECVTYADMRRVVRKLVTLAKSGDVAAIKLLLEHMVGKPMQRVELDHAQLLKLDWDGLYRSIDGKEDVIEAEIEAEQEKLTDDGP